MTLRNAVLANNQHPSPMANVDYVQLTNTQQTTAAYLVNQVANLAVVLLQQTVKAAKTQDSS